MKHDRKLTAALTCLALSMTGAASAAEDPHAGHGHADPLHFAHPLVTESPLPENEARLAFIFEKPADGGEAYTMTGTVELALARWFSVELATPVTHLEPTTGESETGLDNVVLGAKFASFAFEDHGLLLAAGVELALPTGDGENGIGSDHTVEVEPWIGFGVKHGRLEWVGRFGAGLPTNQNNEKEADVELEWATSLLYHVNDRVAALIEFDGLSIFGEEEDGFNNVSVTPGVRWYAFENRDYALGFGVRLPLTDDREADVQVLATLYLHF